MLQEDDVTCMFVGCLRVREYNRLHQNKNTYAIHTWMCTYYLLLETYVKSELPFPTLSLFLFSAETFSLSLFSSHTFLLERYHMHQETHSFTLARNPYTHTQTKQDNKCIASDNHIFHIHILD